ncbi:hypothetical protein ACFX13_036334 [Malus domestica]
MPMLISSHSSFLSYNHHQMPRQSFTTLHHHHHRHHFLSPLLLFLFLYTLLPLSATNIEVVTVLHLWLQTSPSPPLSSSDFSNWNPKDPNPCSCLPAEIGKLVSLEVIRAGGNKDISGKIPDELGNCKNLQVLGLADTQVSSSLPASLELGNLQKLEKMLLWQNNLEGTIPEEIGNCGNLITIDLSLNSVSGSIPQSFGNLSNIEELMLSNNNISGSIPSVLYNATKLLQLQLNTNH